MYTRYTCQVFITQHIVRDECAVCGMLLSYTTYYPGIRVNNSCCCAPGNEKRVPTLFSGQTAVHNVYVYVVLYTRARNI